MTDNTLGSEITRRKGFETINEEVDGDNNQVNAAEEEIKDAKEIELKRRSTWETTKYYFNRFRYYHFVVADTVDKYLSAAMLWLINMYFKLFMGVGPEPASVLTEED